MFFKVGRGRSPSLRLRAWRISMRSGLSKKRRNHRTLSIFSTHHDSFLEKRDQKKKGPNGKNKKEKISPSFAKQQKKKKKKKKKILVSRQTILFRFIYSVFIQYFSEKNFGHFTEIQWRFDVFSVPLGKGPILDQGQTLIFFVLRRKIF